MGHPPRAAVRLQRRRERALRAAGDRDVRALAEPALLRQPARLHVPAARRVLGPLGLARGGRRRVRGRPGRRRSRSRACSPRCSARPPSGCSRGPARGCSTAASALIAGALLAVAFLPVHYAHLAVNDVPGARAAVPEPGRRGGRATATGGCATTRSPGAALGVACATKYTAGIVLLCAARRAPRDRRRTAGAGSRWRARCARRRLRGRQPVRAVRPRRVPRRAAAAVRGVERRRRQARARRGQRRPLLPRHAHLGARLAARARRRRRRGLAGGPRPRGWRSCSSRRRCSSCSSWARRTASSRAGCCRSTRCCACSRRGRRSSALRRARAARRALVAGGAAVRAGARVLRPQRPSCSRATTRAALARDWMVANVPVGTKVVIEPIAPDQLGDRRRPTRRRLDRQRPPLEQVARRSNFRRAAASSSRTTSARSARRCSAATTRGGYCCVVTGSTQYGRALAEPDDGARGDRLLPRARAPRRRRLPRQPDDGAPIGRRSRSTSRSTATRSTTTGSGPEIVIYGSCERAGVDCASQYPRGSRDHAAADRPRPPRPRDRAGGAAAAARTTPNPLVGAVVVKDGEVIGEGFHTAYGEPHAEREALAACSAPTPRGATLYVSLEPCCHHGQTPPCTDAILEAGIARVVVGLRRPDREGRRPRPGHPARRGRRGRGRRRRAGRRARGCSTSRSASTRAPAARACSSSRR